MKLSEYLNAITKDKTELDFNDNEVKKGYVPYIINRFVSMCDLYIPIVNQINQYDLSKDIHFKFYQALLPKRKQFFKYIPKAKDLNVDEKRKIAKYFEIGLKEAEQYIRIMSQEDIDKILEIYKGIKDEF